MIGPRKNVSLALSVSRLDTWKWQRLHFSTSGYREECQRHSTRTGSRGWGCFPKEQHRRLNSRSHSGSQSSEEGPGCQRHKEPPLNAQEYRRAWSRVSCPSLSAERVSGPKRVLPHSIFLTFQMGWESLCFVTTLTAAVCKPWARRACVLTQSCPTLWDPVDVARRVPLSMEFSRQEYWSGLPVSLPGDLPTQGTEPVSPVSTSRFFFFFFFRPLSRLGSPLGQAPA